MPEEISLFEDDPFFRERDKEDIKKKPLADRMRPNTLEEFFGQEHLVGERAFLSEAITHDEISSLIFWGPPGSGKTTLANIISNSTNAEFVSFSAVISGVNDIRKVIAHARGKRKKTLAC